MLGLGISQVWGQSVSLGSPGNLDLCIGNAPGSGYSVETGLIIFYTGPFNASNIFRLELSDPSGDFANPTLLGTGGDNGSGYWIDDFCCIDPGTPPSPDYLMRVISTDPVVVSDTHTVVIREMSRPVLNLTSTPGDGQVTLDWDDPGGCIGGYLILAQEGIGYAGSDITEANLDERAIVHIANSDWSARSSSNEMLTNYYVGKDDTTYIVGDVFNFTGVTSHTITGLTNGETYYFRVLTYKNNADLNMVPIPVGDFSTPVDTFATPEAPLPAVNLQLEAQPEGQAVRLRWRVEREENLSHYVLERSATGEAFVPVGRRSARAEPQQAARYQLWDQQPLPGRSYYRLRTVDLDGTVQQASPVQVVRGSLATSTTLSPQPATEAATLRWTQARAAPYHWELLDLRGRVLRQWRGQAAVGETVLSLPVGDLPAGWYQLRGQVDGHTRIKRLMKQ